MAPDLFSFLDNAQPEDESVLTDKLQIAASVPVSAAGQSENRVPALTVVTPSPLLVWGWASFTCPSSVRTN